MRQVKKILITCVVIFLILYSVAFLIILFNGKAILVGKLSELTHKQVKVGYLGLTPPFSLSIKNLDIEGMLKAEEVFISPSIPLFLTGRIGLNRIRLIKPEFVYERGKPTSESAALSLPSTEAPAKKRGPRVIFKRLNIRDGKIYFIDHTVGEPGLGIIVKDINFNVTNLYSFPTSVITNFDLKGTIPWQEAKEEGKVELEGWLNLLKRNMEARVKISDIDGIYLYPYYSQWVDLDKARIERAKLNFSSNIHGLDNNVTAECHLELSDIVRRPLAEGEEQGKAAKIADAVLDIFRALNQGKIVLDFTIHTKMDRPEFGFTSIKTAVEDKLVKARNGKGFKAQDIVDFPTELLKGMVKGATDLSKAVIDGVFAVGNEVKKSVEGAMKK